MLPLKTLIAASLSRIVPVPVSFEDVIGVFVVVAFNITVFRLIL